jgi:hypothetical protein
MLPSRLPNDFVRPCQHVRRYRKPHLLDSLQIDHDFRLFTTDKEVEKSVVYGRRRSRFIEGARLFDAGLN